jgi:hypothetical protein
VAHHPLCEVLDEGCQAARGVAHVSEVELVGGPFYSQRRSERGGSSEGGNHTVVGIVRAPVDVGKPHDGGSNTLTADRLDQVLAGDLRPPVDVDGSQGGIFRDGDDICLPINLATAGEDDPRRRASVPRAVKHGSQPIHVRTPAGSGIALSPRDAGDGSKMDDSDDVFERFGDALKVAHVAPLEMVGSKIETAYVVSALREGAAEVTANEARRARDQNPFHPTLRCSETVGPSSPPRVSEVAWSAQMRSALPSGHLLRGYVLTVSAVVPDPSQGHEADVTPESPVERQQLTVHRERRALLGRVNARLHVREPLRVARWGRRDRPRRRACDRWRRLLRADLRGLSYAAAWSSRALLLGGAGVGVRDAWVGGRRVEARLVRRAGAHGLGHRVVDPEDDALGAVLAGGLPRVTLVRLSGSRSTGTGRPRSARA